MAIRGYAQQFPEALPALWRTEYPQPWQNFSWRVELLPFLDEDNRYEKLQKDRLPLDPVNVALAGPIAVFSCPSSPGFPRVIHSLGPDPVEGLSLGATDYVPVFDVRAAFESVGQSGAWYGGAAPDRINVAGDGFRDGDLPLASVDRFNAQIRTVPATLTRVRDGLSNTVLLTEQAGKPRRYQRIDTEEQAPIEGAWLTAEYASFHAGGVNQDNHAGPFGFHNGASVVMCDASVHFWPPSMDQQVMIALLTRDGSEILNDGDW
jgi:hypothetical protein